MSYPVFAVDIAFNVATSMPAPASSTNEQAIWVAAKIRRRRFVPGVIRTPMHAPETHEWLAALHPVARLGDIDDVVQAVLFLESAGFVTGEILHVDGGQSAGH